MRRPYSPLVIAAAFLSGAIAGGVGSAVVRVFLLADFDPKFRDVPSLAFQLELLGVALLAVLGSVVLLVTLLIETKLRSGPHRTDRQWTHATVGGFLYIPVVTWIVDLLAGPSHPESALAGVFSWILLGAYPAILAFALRRLTSADQQR